MQKPTEEDFSAAAVQRWVLMETVQHPATILPAAGALVSGVWNGAFGVTSGGLAMTLGFVFVSGASWLYNFFIRGEALAEKRVEDLLQASADGELHELENLSQRCEQAKFTAGAKEANEVLSAYRRLCGYLDAHSASQENISAERLRSLARDTFREGVSLTRQALATWEAITAIDVGLLKRELAKLEATSTREKSSDGAPPVLRGQQIESYKKRLASVDGRKQELETILAQLNELEGALERAYLESVNVIEQDSTALHQMGHAATQLERAVAAAKRVEDRLRDTGPKDDASDTVYLEASKRAEP